MDRIDPIGKSASAAGKINFCTIMTIYSRKNKRGGCETFFIF